MTSIQSSQGIEGSVSYIVNMNWVDPVGHPTRRQIVQKRKDIWSLEKDTGQEQIIDCNRKKAGVKSSVLRHLDNES